MTDCFNSGGSLKRPVLGSAASSIAQRPVATALGGKVSPLPPVVVTSRDYRRLRSLLETSVNSVDEGVLRFLAQELDRAVVCPPDAIAPDIVTMNSRVVFRRHTNLEIESRALVYEDEYAVFGATVPVLSPLGVALLGLRAGSAMPYASLDGMHWLLSVEEVAYQPEAQGRHLRAMHRRWPGPFGERRRSEERAPVPDREDEHRTVVPLRPRPRPRPVVPGDDDDPDPNRAA